MSIFEAAADFISRQTTIEEPGNYRDDPVAWVHERLREHLWSKQAEILESVRDNRRTAVPSGHGVGKSRVASRAVAWWIDTHPPAETRVVTTAATFAQVRNVLWQEIGTAARAGNLDGRILQTEWHILDQDEDDDGKKNGDPHDVIVGIGRKPSDYDQSAFQGVHARYVLVVIDEGDGVSKQLYTQASALATGEHCRILTIGNPVDPESQMAHICQPGSGWNVIQLSVLDLPTFDHHTVAGDPILTELFADLRLTPNDEPLPDGLRDVLTGPDYVHEMLKDFGQDAPEFISRVLGRYPVDASDGVVPSAAVATARKPRPALPADHFPLELGVDVGAGSDLAVVRARRGILAMPHRYQLRTREPDRVVDLVMTAVDELHPTSVKIDGIGWGWGIAAAVRTKLQLRALRGHPNIPVHIVLVSERSAEPRRFFNIRAELWWTARDMCADGVWDLSQLPDDDPVLKELQAPRYTTRGDRIIVEPKEETIKRLKRSPDDADALNLAYYTPRPRSDVRQVRAGQRWGNLSGRR